MRFNLLGLCAAQRAGALPRSKVGGPSNALSVLNGILHQVGVLLTIMFS